MEVVVELIRRLVNENATRALDQTGYQKRSNLQVERYEKLEQQANTVSAIIDEKKQQSIVISSFMFTLAELDELPIEFTEILWMATVDIVTVYSDDRMVYRFKDGRERV
jgi:site-specific DNA recombinase